MRASQWNKCAFVSVCELCRRRIAYEVIGKLWQHIKHKAPRGINWPRRIFTWFVELQLFSKFRFCFHFKLERKVWPSRGWIWEGRCKASSRKFFVPRVPETGKWTETAEKKKTTKNRRIIELQCRRLVISSKSSGGNVALCSQFIPFAESRERRGTHNIPLNFACQQQPEGRNDAWRGVDSCVFYEGHICKRTNQITVNADAEASREQQHRGTTKCRVTAIKIVARWDRTLNGVTWRGRREDLIKNLRFISQRNVIDKWQVSPSTAAAPFAPARSRLENVNPGESGS